MVRHFYLLTAGVVLLAFASSASPAHATTSDRCGLYCVGGEGGGSNAKAGKHDVVVHSWKRRHEPGGGQSEASGSGAWSGPEPFSLPDDVTLTAAQLVELQQALCGTTGSCAGNALDFGTFDANVLNPGSAKPGTPARTVTAGDVARFLPATAVLHEEPDGWAATGVPANFWLDVQAVTVSAPLLGTTADVHFTPVAYEWRYGDGAVRDTADPGASWSSLGQEQLSATPTGHVYTSRGSVQASVVVVYAAEYRIDGGVWIPIAGAVEGDAPPLPVLVVNERTVLTNGG